MMKMLGGRRTSDDEPDTSSHMKKRGSFDDINDCTRALSNNSMSKKMATQMDAMFQPSLKMSRRFSYADNRVTRILLTGGPCAGKTTAMASISQDLTQLGYKVLVVPEAATLIMKGGAMIVSNAFTPEQGLMF